MSAMPDRAMTPPFSGANGPVSLENRRRYPGRETGFSAERGDRGGGATPAPKPAVNAHVYKITS